MSLFCTGCGEAQVGTGRHCVACGAPVSPRAMGAAIAQHQQRAHLFYLS